MVRSKRRSSLALCAALAFDASYSDVGSSFLGADARLFSSDNKRRMVARRTKATATEEYRIREDVDDDLLLDDAFWDEPIISTDDDDNIEVLDGNTGFGGDDETTANSSDDEDAANILEHRDRLENDDLFGDEPVTGNDDDKAEVLSPSEQQGNELSITLYIGMRPWEHSIGRFLAPTVADFLNDDNDGDEVMLSPNSLLLTTDRDDGSDDDPLREVEARFDFLSSKMIANGWNYDVVWWRYNLTYQCWWRETGAPVRDDKILLMTSLNIEQRIEEDRQGTQTIVRQLRCASGDNMIDMVGTTHISPSQYGELSFHCEDGTDNCDFHDYPNPYKDYAFAKLPPCGSQALTNTGIPASTDLEVKADITWDRKRNLLTGIVCFFLFSTFLLLLCLLWERRQRDSKGRSSSSSEKRCSKEAPCSDSIDTSFGSDTDTASSLDKECLGR